MTNSYLSALNLQQGATRAAQDLTGGPATGTTPALPSPNQMPDWLSRMLGLNTTPPMGMNAATWNTDINRAGGLSALQQQTPFGSPVNPYSGNDVTRLSTNPFDTTSAARDLFR
jgi:hypothetical protein